MPEGSSGHEAPGSTPAGPPGKGWPCPVQIALSISSYISSWHFWEAWGGRVHLTPSLEMAKMRERLDSSSRARKRWGLDLNCSICVPGQRPFTSLSYGERKLSRVSFIQSLLD